MCGTAHRRASNTVDSKRPLAVCDDMRRICTMVGQETET
jgi:hypothetical protein